MTAASSLAFPGSRTLAGWWRQLVPLGPQALWVGHLFLHHVEALVAAVRSHPLDPLHRFILQALAAEQTGTPFLPPFLQRLDARLHLGSPLLRQLLRALATAGLAEPGAGDAWAVTALGREALARGEYALTGQERRVFHFVESAGGAGAGPHFLYLNGHAGVPWPVGDDWGFDVSVLRACVRQPEEWKQRHGFPQDVCEILDQLAQAAPAWERVIVDRPERLPVALVRTGPPEHEAELLGFPVRQEGWALQVHHPVFAVREDGLAPFADLESHPLEQACRQAWRAWCQPRGLPADEVEACALRPAGVRLHVAAPAPLVERLRVARSDALKGEAWLLIGEGLLRAAAVLEVTAGT
jgi:hypothetical protein